MPGSPAEASPGAGFGACPAPVPGAFHATADRFARDRERQNTLVAEGWTVLRFTWHDLTGRPEYVIRTIQAMLVRTQHGRPGRSS